MANIGASIPLKFTRTPARTRGSGADSAFTIPVMSFRPVQKMVAKLPGLGSPGEKSGELVTARMDIPPQRWGESATTSVAPTQDFQWLRIMSSIQYKFAAEQSWRSDSIRL